MVWLITGAVLLIVGCVLIGYCFMWETFKRLPFPERPIGASKARTLPSLTGFASAITGIVLLFIFRWYAGLASILVGWVGVKTCHGIWLSWAASVNERAR